MNPTPNPQQSQDVNPQEQKANEAAASLSFATHLSTQMMQHQNPKQEMQQPQQEATPQEQPQQESDPKVQELETKVDDMEKKLEEMITKKIDEFKQTISDALADE